MQVPFKELKTAAGHSLMRQTFNQEVATLTKSEENQEKTCFLLNKLCYITLERQMNTLPTYTCYSTAQREETVRHEISTESEGRFLEMQ